MKQVIQYLRANRSRFIDELCEYLRFPSVSAQPEHKPDLEACAQWIARHCEGIGLKTTLHRTQGNPIILARTPPAGKKRRPHFIVYGHYDVQPPEPFELWKTPPFEPTIRGSSLFARGASDNKGQHFAHLKAIEAFLKTGTPLPCDVTVMLEGEEEVGSEALGPFIKKRAKELSAQAIVISDTGIPSPKHPSLTYSLRGVAALDVKVTGPNRDLHSGIFGGSVHNPASVLCQLLAGLHDRNGRVTVPGFYDGVEKLTPFERKELARIPFDAAAYKRFLGVPSLFGEKGFSPVEQRSARPTLEINGLTSGYQGEGSKTIVPSSASAKITVRLVPNQDPQKTIKAICNHLKKTCPATVRLQLTPGHAGEPYLVSPTSAYARASLAALQTAFGVEPLLLREGGSIPIVTEFKRILKADSLLLGLALPDDNAHSPNEKFDLRMFEKGMRLSAELWGRLAAV